MHAPSCEYLIGLSTVYITLIKRGIFKMYFSDNWGAFHGRLAFDEKFQKFRNGRKW